LLNLKLKHAFSEVCGLLALLPQMDVVKGSMFAAPGGIRACYRVMAILFRNKLHWLESQWQHIIFSFWICFILTHIQLNYAVTHPLFNHMFQ